MKAKLFVLLTVVALVLTACAPLAAPAPAAPQATQPPAAEPTKAPPAAEKVTLTVWRPQFPPELESPTRWWDDGDQIMKMWAVKNPNVEIKIEAIPFEQYDTKQLTALKGGGAPDINFVNHVTVGAAVGTGGLQPLDDCIAANPVIDPKDWIPGMYAVGTREGKQYTLPWDTDTRVLWWNKKLLAEAGVTKTPETWDEMLDALNKIDALKKPGVYGWGYFGGSYWGVLYQDIGPYLVQMGTSFLTPDGNASAALDPKTVKAFTYAVELAKHAPEGAVNYTNEMDNLFAQAKQAFYIWGMWYNATIKQLAPDWKYGVDYEVTLIPGPEKGKTGSSNGGWQLAVAKESKHPKEVCEFLAWVTSPEVMALGTKDHIPTRLSAQKAEYFRGDPVVEMSMQQSAFGQPPVPTVTELPEIAQLVQKQFIRAVTGEVTAEEALKEIDKQITELLAKR